MTKKFKNMSKEVVGDDFFSRLKAEGMKIGEPASLHYGGCSSMLTARPRNIMVWLYDNAPSHYMHKRFAMGVSLVGGCVVGIDGREFALNPGEGVLIFPFQAHYITPAEPGNMVNFAVTFALGDASDNSLSPLRDSVFSVSGRDVAILCELAAAGRQGAAGKRSHEAAHLLEWFLCRKLREKSLKPEADSSKSMEASKYSQIVSHIRSNISAPLSVKDIAGAVGLSVSQLRRVFNERTGGLNLARFILSLRIKQAYEMLMHTDLNIAEIGEKCGFSDQFVFSRAFKRMAGLSPANYRKQRRNKD